MTLLTLESPTRDYPWGSRDRLSQVLGRTPSGGPEAELWIGAHESGSSLVVDASNSGSSQDSLRGVLAEQPQLLGGHESLPFLFKILSAAEPLSLQVHPSEEQARAGFAQENRARIPKTAVHRNYKDPNHKPELIYALTEFEALCGFLPGEEIQQRFEAYGLHQTPAMRVLESLKADDLQGAFQGVFTLTRHELAEALAQIKESAAALNGPLSIHLLSLMEHHGNDPGVLGALMLNYKKLLPGEALFLEAGVLHSYLSGTGLEIMASSDNVLRGGLTKKHIDVPELIQTLRFERHVPSCVNQKQLVGPGGTQLKTFEPPIDEFQLTVGTLRPGAVVCSRGPHVVLVLSGDAYVSTATSGAALHQGGHAFCAADEDYALRGHATVAVAAVGGSHSLNILDETTQS